MLCWGIKSGLHWQHTLEMAAYNCMLRFQQFQILVCVSQLIPDDDPKVNSTNWFVTVGSRIGADPKRFEETASSLLVSVSIQPFSDGLSPYWAGLGIPRLSPPVPHILQHSHSQQYQILRKATVDMSAIQFNFKNTANSSYFIKLFLKPIIFCSKWQ